jgi:hypothetical protein
MWYSRVFAGDIELVVNPMRSAMNWFTTSPFNMAMT